MRFPAIRHLAAALAAAILAAAASQATAQGATAQGATAQGADAKAASDPKAAALVAAFEKKLNLQGLDITNTFTLVQKKEGEADRVIRIQIYRRDAADTFTMLFQYPDSEKGKGYFRSGDDLYLYLPSTREFVYRNRKDDVAGSDVRTDLFGKSSILEQYAATMAGGAKVASWDCDVVKLDARKLDVAYPQQRLYLRRTDGLPVKAENLSAAGVLLRTLYYVDYKEAAPGKFIFSKLLSVDALEKGQKTFLTNDGISTAKIPDYTFSKAFLEEKSR
jgi:negative regulator of sigma E activity